MPWCMGHCKDPEGNLCRADANSQISNFDEVKDQLEIPGCMCEEGFVKATGEPFSECLPEGACVMEDPECPANSHWEWEAPSCFRRHRFLKTSPNSSPIYRDIGYIYATSYSIYSPLPT